jgi:hypothetical protein
MAAFGIDEGESLGALLLGPPIPALGHLDVDEQGFGWISEDDFVNHLKSSVTSSTVATSSTAKSQRRRSTARAHNPHRVARAGR